MASTRIITIGNQQVEATEDEIPQANLLFYPENPRVFNALHAELGDNPSQLEIEKHMKSLEHVKVLKMSIEANGGLLEPIIVRKNIVLEGNSRLAAYRLLAAMNPIKWGKIKANVLPDDTSDELVDSLLGTLHVIGKAPWSPFEQAGFLARSLNRTRKPIEALSNELGLSLQTAKSFIRVYNMMLENDDAQPSKWSYYFELDKNRDIKKADENLPSLELVQNVIEMIKDDKIPKAQDIRTIGKIVSAPGETAREATESLLSGDISIDEAAELAKDDTKLKSLRTRMEAFQSFVLKEKKNIRDNYTNPALNHTIKQIITLLNSTIK